MTPLEFAQNHQCAETHNLFLYDNTIDNDDDNDALDMDDAHE